MSQAVASRISSFQIESLETRTLLAAWGYWPQFLAQDKALQARPWLNGTGNNVAVIDQGIDYYHPALGGNQATGARSPRVINIWDYRDNDTNPFPSESETVNPSTAHGTGVAGIIGAYPYDYNGKHYQGVAQGSLLYNLRVNRLDDQATTKQALQWVLANHAKYKITVVVLSAVTLSSQKFPLYGPELQSLWNAGIFVVSPVANIWNYAGRPHAPIGYPAKSPYVFGAGGIVPGGAFDPRSQRGPGLDILGPSDKVSLPYYYPSKNQHVYTDFGQGNSWSAPYVAGAALLMKQVDPSLRPADIMGIMQASGIATVDPDKTGNYVRLNIANAINTTYEWRDDVYSKGQGNHTSQQATNIRFKRGTASVANLKLLVGAPDWYSFTVPAAGNYFIRLGYNTVGQRAAATLYDGSVKTLTGIGWRGYTAALKPGKYYVQVNSGASLLGTYSVNIAALTTQVTMTRTAARRLAAQAAAAAAQPMFVLAPVTARQSATDDADSILA